MPPISESPPIRGHAWFVYPDPASATVSEPFAETDTEGETPPPGMVRRPPGIVDFWTANKAMDGLKNTPTGHSYLVLTETLEPPGVAEGWLVEPAHLAERFQADQRGTRWVQLVRVHRTDETEWGPVQDCEFQVVKG